MARKKNDKPAEITPAVIQDQPITETIEKNYMPYIMTVIVALLWWPKRKTTTPFHWSWAIPLISIFLSAADFAYFYALSEADSMISVVSMVRRGSVIVSFLCGAMLFHERNLKAKAIDLALILVGMLFLWIGSK